MQLFNKCLKFCLKKQQMSLFILSFQEKYKATQRIFLQLMTLINATWLLKQIKTLARTLLILKINFFILF